MSTTKNTTNAQEGPVAEMIESQTAKIPSDGFLWAAGSFMAISMAFKLVKKDHVSLFFGQWVAPMLLFGIYNKIVKTLGHDSEDNDEEESPEDQRSSMLEQTV